MINKFYFWFLSFCVYSTSAVIYHLNDSEYQRMPPLFSLDDYESCLVEEGSTYCVLQLNLYAEPGNELMRMVSEYSELETKHYNHAVIDRGVRIRKTCQKYIRNSKTTKDLANCLEVCLNDSLREDYGLNAKVSTLYYCEHNNESRHIDAWDWTVLVIIVALVLLNIIGSLNDYYMIYQSDNITKYKNLILLSFSVTRNWNSLTNTQWYDPKLKDLQLFHGIRAISTLCVVLAHSLFIFSSGFTINTRNIEESFEQPQYLVIYCSGAMFVQIFFFISGFLTIYNLRLEEKTRNLTARDLSKIIMLRFIRFVPSLAMTLALSTTWVRHISSGPVWNRFTTSTLVADCRAYWWRHLFFINNYLHDSNHCLITTWHLAAEMQVFVVCVTAYILTRGRARRLVLGGLLLLSTVAPALHTVLHDLDAVVMTPELFRTSVAPTFMFQEILGHNNLPCFIIGMITASKLYDWLKKERNFLKNKWCKLVQHLVIPLLVLLLFSRHWFYSDGPRPSLLVRATYSAAIRLILGGTFALLTSIFIMTSTTSLKRLFEWRGWWIPSRLSYCLYLLHIVLIHVARGSTAMLTFSGFNMMIASFSFLLGSCLVSVLFYLMVEAPFATLFKTIVKKEYLITNAQIIQKHE